MAGDWIKMRIDLPDDPAVFKLSSITKLDRMSIIGRLYAFWTWADRHAVDGRVDGGSSTVVDEITRHDGFASALVSVNWLLIGDDFIALPKHERHNGESAKERGLKNARQARWRAGKEAAPSAPVDALPSTRPSTDTSTREEKRREEKKITTAAPDGFAEFYEKYPKKVGKPAALKAFRAARVNGNLTDLLTDIEHRMESGEWTTEKIQFVPNPATYLNQRRWEDERAERVDQFAGCI